uniref:Uncharacterized protein n=1 Tax=Candidatus Methanophagaceae archaeon ANME-1 ERB6 TaxID=2759912 RepID=A0A7G9Z017_9EURY|nr:hypothetical protein NGENPBHE_00001 [Methanosarcinales archaeon ANME-1 ERB6]
MADGVRGHNTGNPARGADFHYGWQPRHDSRVLSNDFAAHCIHLGSHQKAEQLHLASVRA